MENKSNYSQVPSRFDVEDEIFIICMMFFNPNQFITKEVEGNIRLNNILYKINENIKLNVFDCFDLI